MGGLQNLPFYIKQIEREISVEQIEIIITEEYKLPRYDLSQTCECFPVIISVHCHIAHHSLISQFEQVDNYLPHNYCYFNSQDTAFSNQFCPNEVTKFNLDRILTRK